MKSQWKWHQTGNSKKLMLKERDCCLKRKSRIKKLLKNFFSPKSSYKNLDLKLINHFCKELLRLQSRQCAELVSMVSIKLLTWCGRQTNISYKWLRTCPPGWLIWSFRRVLSIMENNLGHSKWSWATEWHPQSSSAPPQTVKTCSQSMFQTSLL